MANVGGIFFEKNGCFCELCRFCLKKVLFLRAFYATPSATNGTRTCHFGRAGTIGTKVVQQTNGLTIKTNKIMKNNKQTEDQAQKDLKRDEQQTVESTTSTATDEPTAEQDLSQKVTELEAKVSQLEDTKLRLMAEFDNFRRRTAKEKLELTETAGERIFADMLPLVDDFERAIRALPSESDETAASADDSQKAIAEGLKLIHQKFLSFLEQHSVVPIETEGKDFSTDEHEAITTLAMGEDKKGKIIDCTQKGYKLGDKVIRYAKVVVGE